MASAAQQELKRVRWELSRLASARLLQSWSARDQSEYDGLTNREVVLMRRSSARAELSEPMTRRSTNHLTVASR
jgi:hypothetical protein